VGPTHLSLGSNGVFFQQPWEMMGNIFEKHIPLPAGDGHMLLSETG